MNEPNTRAEKIDPMLKSVGWSNVDSDYVDVVVHREYPINEGAIRPNGTREKPSRADYVLEYKNQKLAVIEAKPDDFGYEEGVAQAKRDAQRLGLGYTYALNGEHIYEMNLKTGEEGLIDSFPTPEELWSKVFGDVNEWRDKFNAIPIDTVGGSKKARYYQELAINKTVQAIAEQKNRLLLTLATGTGKTFIASQIAWKLFKSKWTLQRDGARAPRILFLADQHTLSRQAYLDFGSFADDAKVRITPEEVRKAGSVPTNASIFFAIFQSFMSGPDGSPYFGEYPKDFFDFIIIDECHRGGANDESTWRDIMNYFSDAVQLGLTATPKRKDNVDTYDYFGNPLYTYSLKEGIADGFLTPFKVIRIDSTLDEYIYSRDDDVLEGDIETGKVYIEGEFNKKIEIEEREKSRVANMLKSINEHEKTIVFCANQEHAAKVRNYINQQSTSNSPDYCVRVTANDHAIGDTHVDNFKDNEKNIPTILTTSRKLSTGVDAKNVRNIVLLREVKSMIEFKQIIGRGTRVFEGKNYFTIIDFVDAYRLFSDPEWDGEPVDPTPPPTPPPTPGPTPGPTPEPTPEPEKRKKAKIKLADGKEREIQSTSSKMFFLNGEVVGAQEFIQKLYDTLKLPEIFESEEKLRELWSNPITRRELLARLEEEGCSTANLRILQELIDAQNSDLYDVLEYISYARAPITRKERVKRADSNISNFLNIEQKEFIDFVLANYIKQGIDELDDSRLGHMISLKYNTIYEAREKLGDLGEVRDIFIEFQKYLYQEAI